MGMILYLLEQKTSLMQKTMKEVNNISRIGDFIKNCIANGWLVNVMNVEKKIDFNQKINEEIELG